MFLKRDLVLGHRKKKSFNNDLNIADHYLARVRKNEQR